MVAIKKAKLGMMGSKKKDKVESYDEEDDHGFCRSHSLAGVIGINRRIGGSGRLLLPRLDIGCGQCGIPSPSSAVSLVFLFLGLSNLSINEKDEYCQESND
mmetsp:Transcript_11415/g.18577  ORF Transcript_11415/g.18577 Transcript_11415/m.18577 type:complete len:101 (-) Transcript_11415:424-726(-)